MPRSASASSITTGTLTVTGTTNTNGNVSITGNLSVSGSTALQGATASTLALSTALPISSGGTGGATAGAARTNLGSTTVGDALFTAATALAGRNALGATAVGNSVFTATDAPTARTALGSTTTGDALFIASSAGSARTTLGSTTVGDALFTAASAGAARTTLGSTTVGDALFIAANAAAGRTALGLGTMSTQNANAVAITGGTITGTTIDNSNSISGSSINSGVVAIANGGTGATDAATARSNLGANDAGNLTAGTLSYSRLPASGVTAGAYNWGTVNAQGIVTAASNVGTSSISQGDSGVFVTDTGTNGTLTFKTENATAMTIDPNGNVGIGTTPSQKLDVNGAIQTRGAAGTNRTLYFSTGSSARWAINASSTAESGSNAGSDLALSRFNDSGTFIDNALIITRSTGGAAFANTVSATGGFYGNLSGNVTGNVTGGVNLGNGTAAAPALTFASDTATGLFKPATSVLAFSTAGAERARIDANGNFGIGTNAPGSLLDVQQTSTITTGTAVLQNGYISMAPTATSNAVGFGSNIGIVANGTANMTGYIIGSQASATNNVAYTLGAAYGTVNNASMANVAGSLAAAYGSSNRAYNNRASGTGVATAIGTESIVGNQAAGTIANAYGSTSTINNAGTGTITASYPMLSNFNNASGGTMSSVYSSYLGYNNSGTVGNWYGLYIPAINGTAPTGARFPIYVADTGTSYLAGTLGIGTSTPAATLDVAGNILTRAGAGGSGYLAYGRASDNFVWAPLAYNNAGSAYLGGINFGTGGMNIAVGSGLGTALTINTSGNVGIGNASPGYKLDVTGSVHIAPSTAGAVYTNALSVESNGTDNGIRYTQDNVGAIWLGNSGVGIIGTDLQPITFKTGINSGSGAIGSTGTEWMRITTAGNVGIGTTSPRTALDTSTGTMSGAANDYIKAQFTMSGGGTVTWGGATGKLKWTGRFIAMNMPASTASAGYIDIVQPTSNIPAAQVYNGSARTADANGVVLNYWEALWAVHTPGGNNGAVSYYITAYPASNVPSNWILVAANNSDDNTIKLGTGVTLAAGGTYTSSTGNAGGGGGSSQWTTSGSNIYYNTGNVGIGTTSPIRKLHVAQATSVEQIWEQTDAQADNRKWNLIVAGGNSSTPASLYFRLLNDAGSASTRDVMVMNGSNGYTGIGTASPAYKLDVNGDIIGGWLRSRGATGWYNETYGGGMYMTDSTYVRTYNNKSLYTGSGNLITSGYIGVNTGSPTYPLSIASNNSFPIWLQGAGQSGFWQVGPWSGSNNFYVIDENSYGMYVPKGCSGGCSWYQNSDRRLKTDITPLAKEKGLATIMALKPVSYHWRDKGMSGTEQIGLVAQDVQEVMPGAVDGGGMSVTVNLPDGRTETVKNSLSVNYNALIVPLVKAAQELESADDALQAEVAEAARKAERLVAGAVTALQAKLEAVMTTVTALRKSFEAYTQRNDQALQALQAENKALRAANDNLGRELADFRKAFDTYTAAHP